MTTIEIRHDQLRRVPYTVRRSAVQAILLACGIAASVLYVATDVLGALRYKGYSFISQAVSELTAIGAASKPLVDPLLITYGVLMIMYGVGVWRDAVGRNRALRVTGALLIAYAAAGLPGPIVFPMHPRGTGGAEGDVGHLALTGVLVLLMLLAMAVGAFALGRRFRRYSFWTIPVFLISGAATGVLGARLAAQQSTPGIGIAERIHIYAFLLWVAGLAIALLRRREEHDPETVAQGVGSRSTGARGARGSHAAASRNRHIEGHVSPGFEPVRDAFVENFTRRHELGGACCVYHRGEKVVDLWGGVRNESTGEPWEEDTMVLVYSATKGFAAMTLAVANSRGWLDYDELVRTYWPEFAQQGKETITVRQLLAHQAGLFALDAPVDRELVADLDRLAVVLARQRPAWTPGTRQGYHAITLGFYEGELLRRVDPGRRSLGQFFQDEIATPLELDFYIRLPESIPDSRLATLSRPSPFAMLWGFPIRLTLDAWNHRSNIYRSLIGSMLPHDDRRIYARDLEVPSGGGVGTARAMAHAYSVFATGGHELGLRQSTLDALSAPAVPPTHGFRDECLKGDVQFSLGFMKPSPTWPFGSASSFGSPGSGGSLGFADPTAGIGYAYVTCQMGTALTGDPRDRALRDALYAILPTPAPR